MTSLLRTFPVDLSQSGTSGVMYRRKTCLKNTYILDVHLFVVLLYTHQIEILNCVMLLEPKMRCTKIT